ncbi:MAG: mechanosensitive ion channel family protein [Chlamydiales bacterium]
MDFSSFFSKWTFLHSSLGWIAQACLIFFFILCFDFIQKKILSRTLRRLKKTQRAWDHTLVEALQTPLQVFIWIVGLSFLAQVIEKETNASIFMVISPLRTLGTIASIAWFLMRFVKKVENNILQSPLHKGETIDRTTLEVIGKVLRGSIITISLLAVLQTLGVSISGLLAFGGIGGLTVGFAAKDLLSNFCGGFMLYWDSPFKVGDWIRSPDRNIEGTVESIGWRLTCIRTFDMRPLYVPNSTFATISVENPSRMSNRRMWETIGVRYEDVAVVPLILQDIRKMLNEHSQIDQNKLLMVYLNSFAPYSLEFFVYAFTRSTEWAKFHEVKEDVLLKVSDIIRQHGAHVALPTSVVRLSNFEPVEPPSPKRRGIPDSSLPATWAAPQALDRHPGGP